MSFSDSPHPLRFFGLLKWIDGRPLLDTIEPYRREILTDALYTFDGDRPQYNLVLNGRGKKNWKTSDLILAVLYRFLAWESPAGNDAFVLANDEGQANDDLSLAKKIILANPVLAREVEIQNKQILRRDGRGVLQILPARDSAGAHGKTFGICAFDEIHAYRSHDLFEALAHDPTRLDALTWITSYAGIRHAPGIPLYDFLAAGKRGDDPRMFFSWYSGDFTTDPALEDTDPETRANPSMASWGNDDYLKQQRRRLPTHKFRRLHLNLPGAPDGAAFDADRVLEAIVPGRKRIAPVTGPNRPDYRAFVDMSGGSSDDAVLAIAHQEENTGLCLLDSIMSQAGVPPFNPRMAVKKFVGELRAYGVRKVVGDRYAGLTFECDFLDHEIEYEMVGDPKSKIYEDFEPRLNAGEVRLLDDQKLQEQFLTLVYRGGKIDHQPGDHDDYANACAGAVMLCGRPQALTLTDVLYTGDDERGKAFVDALQSISFEKDDPDAAIYKELHEMNLPDYLHNLDHSKFGYLDGAAASDETGAHEMGVTGLDAMSSNYHQRAAAEPEGTPERIRLTRVADYIAGTAAGHRSSHTKRRSA